MNNCLLIGEIGINHNGDINIVKQLIDSAKLCGCYAVKFQKRDINLVYSKEELDKPRESPWGKTNRDQKQGLEFCKKEYDEIDLYCREKGIKWFASPWDEKSVDFLMQYDIPFIKIASASNMDIKLLKKIKETNKPVVISTGMSNEQEIDNLIIFFGDQIKYILSCTSTYPTKTEDMNMNKILTLKRKYGDRYKMGFSNHSPGIQFIIMAYILGCEMIEYHITMGRHLYGSDQAASIEFPGMWKIKDWINGYEKCWGNGKIECLDNEKSILQKLRKK